MRSAPIRFALLPLAAIAVAAMTFVIFGVFWSAETGHWVVDWQPTDGARAEMGLRSVAWPLYPLIGATITVGLGMLFGLRHSQRPASEEHAR